MRTNTQNETWMQGVYDHPRTVRVFQELTGKWHYSDDSLDYLDARGTCYSSEHEAKRAARLAGYLIGTDETCQHGHKLKTGFAKELASHLNKAEATTATPLQITDKDYGTASVGSGSPNNAVRQAKVFRDYEPEQKYGTAADIQEHIRYGGTMENY